MQTTRARFTRRRRKWDVTIDFLTINDQNMLEQFVQKHAVYGANLFSFTDTRQPVASEIVFDENGGGIITLATGHLTWFESRPLAWGYESIVWSDFALISAQLPDDADIQGIYPVFIGSTVFASVTTMAFRYGTAVPMTGPPAGVGQFTSPSNPDDTTFSSTEFSGPSIGTSLSALVGQQIGVETADSLTEGPALTDEVTITGVGYAVLYTSAAPTIDAAMPPPFAVPSGQGLAWAIPTAVAFTGPTGAQGTATGTAGSNSDYAIIGSDTTTPQALLVRFNPIPSYTDAGWMAGGFRQNCSFGIEEA